MSTVPVGIDLGTTYSAVATIGETGEVSLLPNKEGKYLTPSVILIEDGNIVVGEVAKDARADMPAAIVEFIKRSMGTERRFYYANQEFSPIELSSLILKKLKTDAEAALGSPITQAVITVPAYFGAERRDATEKAARIAGIEVLALINEPTAAAMAFGMGGDRKGTALVFDLGGGTFDVTVVMFADDNTIEVLSSDGDAELGGKDFDDEIIKFVIQEFNQIHGVDIAADMEATAELRQKAEKAKQDLSARDSTTISLNINGQKLRMELTREQFSAAIQPLLEGMKFTIRTVLEDCGLGTNDITDVLLVGGSTRVQAVRQMVREFFGREPNTTVHPDEAVAKGAALFAAKTLASTKPNCLPPELRERAKALPAVHDVAPHSIGISVVDEQNKNQMHNAIVLQRGTALPTTITDRFKTSENGQTSVKIDVNEGEEESLDFVNNLGSFVLNLATPRPAGSPIDVQVGLDLSGIIRVLAVDVESGQRQDIAIDYTVNISEQEVRERSNWLSRQIIL